MSYKTKIGELDVLQGGLSARSTVGVRSFSLTSSSSSSSTSKKVGACGAGNLKMAMMSMGSGAVLSKQLAINPQQVVVSREKEKIALQELNDRFAAYIERVRFLEADNNRLQKIIAELTLKFEQLDATLRAIYDEELRAARATIDKTTALQVAAELRARTAEAKLLELTALYKAEVEAHGITKESIPQLEKMISERDAQIDYLTKNVTSMEMEFRRLKGQSAVLQQDLVVAKQAADAETVARVELESIAQTREDELVFMKSMYEEKVKALMSFDLGSDAFKSAFSNELALALRDIRAEYESIMEATRTQDTDAWYRAKFNEVMTQTQKQTGELSMAKEEVRTWRNKYHALNGDYASLRAMISGLEGRIQALTADLAAAEAAYLVMMEEKDGKIASCNYEITQLISQLKDLTDFKLALDAEIATYRRLLQAEDGRIYSSSTITSTTKTTIIINPFIQCGTEEDEYYRAAFMYCDADRSGHVTTTELKNAFEWMNQHNFGGRTKREVSYPYVNEILKKGDVDSSLTLEYPEFVRLMKMEKKIHVENALTKYVAGVCGLDEAINIFKQAGYVFSDAWFPFLNQYKLANGQINYQQIVPLL